MFSTIGVELTTGSVVTTAGVGSTFWAVSGCTTLCGTSATATVALLSTVGVVLTASSGFFSSFFSFFPFLLPVAINIINAIKSNKTPPVISNPWN